MPLVDSRDGGPHLPTCDLHETGRTDDHPRPADDRLPDGVARFLASDVLADLRPPRLVRVREPDQLRVERAHQPLAFGVRLAEPAEKHRRGTGAAPRPP